LVSGLHFIKVIAFIQLIFYTLVFKNGKIFKLLNVENILIFWKIWQDKQAMQGDAVDMAILWGVESSQPYTAVFVVFQALVALSKNLAFDMEKYYTLMK